MDCNAIHYPRRLTECHNLQSLRIDTADGVISNGLTDLISAQGNLKSLIEGVCTNFIDTVPSLTKVSDTLTSFSYRHYGRLSTASLLFIAKFKNLQ